MIQALLSRGVGLEFKISWLKTWDSGFLRLELGSSNSFLRTSRAKLAIKLKGTKYLNTI